MTISTFVGPTQNRFRDIEGMSKPRFVTEIRIGSTKSGSETVPGGSESKFRLERNQKAVSKHLCRPPKSDGNLENCLRIKVAIMFFVIHPFFLQHPHFSKNWSIKYFLEAGQGRVTTRMSFDANQTKRVLVFLNFMAKYRLPLCTAFARSTWQEQFTVFSKTGKSFRNFPARVLVPIQVWMVNFLQNVGPQRDTNDFTQIEFCESTAPSHGSLFFGTRSSDISLKKKVTKFSNLCAGAEVHESMPEFDRDWSGNLRTIAGNLLDRTRDESEFFARYLASHGSGTLRTMREICEAMRENWWTVRVHEPSFFDLWSETCETISEQPGCEWKAYPPGNFRKHLDRFYCAVWVKDKK